MHTPVSRHIAQARSLNLGETTSYSILHLSFFSSSHLLLLTPTSSSCRSCWSRRIFILFSTGSDLVSSSSKSPIDTLVSCQSRLNTSKNTSNRRFEHLTAIIVSQRFEWTDQVWFSLTLPSIFCSSITCIIILYHCCFSALDSSFLLLPPSHFELNGQGTNYTYMLLATTLLVSLYFPLDPTSFLFTNF